MGDVLVFAEHKHGHFPKSTLVAVNAGLEMARKRSGNCIAVVTGDSCDGVAGAIAKYGVRTLARGGRFEALEGTARSRNVVLECESYEAARAFYFSPEYSAARAMREGAAIVEYVLVEGA